LAGQTSEGDDGRLATALTTVVRQLSELGWAKVADADVTLTTLQVRRSGAGSPHVVEFPAGRNSHATVGCGANPQKFASSPFHIHISQLQHVDSQGRVHHLDVIIPPRFPSVPPTCLADLPRTFDLKWSVGGGSLGDVYEQFVRAVDRYQVRLPTSTYGC